MTVFAKSTSCQYGFNYGLKAPWWEQYISRAICTMQLQQNHAVQTPLALTDLKPWNEDPSSPFIPNSGNFIQKASSPCCSRIWCSAKSEIVLKDEECIISMEKETKNQPRQLFSHSDILQPEGLISQRQAHNFPSTAHYDTDQWRLE